ncbi:hypothetical protein A2635_05100 [Candidatus Peribacteria bacterium RIFCSPHIGHO2_01_FULL_51_9]|nr:MAG: hypothetical protein A2635_05100 [Candidatus Peribacteria bacterium RIFCSPHIGHO2_01_FULL_51_9]
MFSGMQAAGRSKRLLSSIYLLLPFYGIITIDLLSLFNQMLKILYAIVGFKQFTTGRTHLIN